MLSLHLIPYSPGHGARSDASHDMAHEPVLGWVSWPMPAAKTGTLVETHSGLYGPDPRGEQVCVMNE